jgi:uncharacterized membrane protein YccC
MSQASFWKSGPSARASGHWPHSRQLTSTLRSAAPALLFGLRLWAAVCLALYIAFWLELDNASWAGTSAAIVCQPSLGSSLRKGWFRMVGTGVGATAIVVLTACFPQDRLGFLLGLAVWGGACGLMVTLLRNFAAYSAALAGYTAAIIASDELGATGGANGDVFMLAITRASEICIGIVCAGVVLAGTDFGGARRRLAVQFAELSAEITGRLAGTFALAGPELSETRPVRRDLVRRVIALDPVIDQALGESSDLRPHSPILQTAVGGLFAALSGWRMVAVHLERLPSNQGRREAGIVLGNMPPELRSVPTEGEAKNSAIDPFSAHRACAAAARALTALPNCTPSLRLLADQTARALIGIRRTFDGLLLLADPARRIPGSASAPLHVPDLLPSLLDGARVFVTIGAVELFWIMTEWPNGPQALVFATIGVILFSQRADQAYALVMSFMVGVALSAVFAAIVEFAILPGVATFASFSLAIGLVLVPASALIAQPWQTVMFTGMAANFIPLLAPANQMSYNPQQFYNGALAIVAGVGVAALAFRLLPPLSPAQRSRRLLALTLRDLRRLTMGPIPRTANEWQGRVYSRLSALPEQAEPLQRAQLVAALSVGTEIIRLRRVVPRFDQDVELDAALNAVAKGDSSAAVERLAQLDQRLAALPNTRPGARARLRARSSILAMSEALAQHAAYFDSGVGR